MLNKVINTIDKYKLISENDRIVVGVSGGSDSMTLLYILNSLKEKYKYSLIACHINHGTREGKSDDDAKFVEEECNKLGIKLYSHHFDLESEASRLKMSSEEAGRKLRYECFEKVLKLEKATKIATAHNANDNVETILLNIFRGTGLNGLCGIPKLLNNIIRPLCELTKVEIEEYASKNNIPYVVDSTNQENVFTRNKVRNELLPYIKENINENVIDNVNKMSNILIDEKNLIEELSKNASLEVISNHIEYSNASSTSKKILKLNLEKFNRYHIAIKRRVLKHALSIVNDNSFKDLSFVHIESVLDLISKGTGKKIEVLNTIVCEVSYNTLMMYKDKVNKHQYNGIDDNNYNTNDNYNKNTMKDNIVKNEIIKVEKEVLILSNDNNYPAIVSNDKNTIIISKNKNDNYNYNYNYEKQSNNQLECGNSRITYRTLNKDELECFKDEIDLTKIKEMSNQKMYFDLDKLIKKTNIISDINIENDYKAFLKKKDTKIYFRFRKRQDGDKILIDHEGHYKKIKDIFIDEKIERDERNKIIIFEKVEKDENENIINEEIVALIGKRMSPKYKIDDYTKYILEIMF